MTIIPPQRHLFDIPDEVAYFNCAYMSPQLKEATKRLIAGVQSKSYPWKRTAPDFFEDAETIRKLSSSVLGGDAEGYAVIPAASYGVSTAARAIEPHMEAGSRILLIAEEFPSNFLPWKRVSQQRGGTLITVPAPADGNWTQAVVDQIDRTIKVLAISTCHWTNGARIDLIPVARACRDTGTILVVDATQTLGVMPFQFEEIRPDFLIAAGYKWLLSPYGFGLLYVSERWRNARPLEESWLARMNAEDFAGLVNYSDVYMPGARRFEMGEKCTPTILPGAIAGLEQLSSWGIENIGATLSAVNAKIAARLSEMGFQLPPDAQRCPHMFGAKLPAGRTINVVSELKKKDIYISQRGDSLRFAPYLHITDSDVDRLLDALDALAR